MAPNNSSKSSSTKGMDTYLGSLRCLKLDNLHKISNFHPSSLRGLDLRMNFDWVELFPPSTSYAPTFQSHPSGVMGTDLDVR